MSEPLLRDLYTGLMRKQLEAAHQEGRLKIMAWLGARLHEIELGRRPPLITAS